jgi:membrane protein DedA with SNARE-associated domain/membrane-associated phospholipid phosphatase
MDFLLDLTNPWGYLLVFGFAFAEGGLLVGLFLPGEAPLLLGGVLASQNRASLWLMVVVAAIGAIVGDSCGFWLGRRYGARLQSTSLGLKIGERRWSRGKDYVRQRGAGAVFFGRFVGVFRTLVPPIAGMSHMRYGRFLIVSAPAGALFATGLVLGGYAAGSSWQVVEDWLGRASLVVLALAIAIGGLWWGARWVAGHYREVRRRFDRALARPRVKRFMERYNRQLTFLRRRLEPGQRFGLVTTAGIGIVLSTGFLFGELLDEVIERDTMGVDRSIVLWLEDHREPALDAIMRAITTLGAGWLAVGVLAGGAAAAYLATRSLELPAFLSFCLVGSVGLAPIIKMLVNRPRPEFSPLIEVGSSAFPSGHATTATIAYLALAFVWTRRQDWRRCVWIWAGAFTIVFLVGFSRIYLGVHWPTDVAGGWMLGAMWVVTGALLTEVVWNSDGTPRGARYPAAEPN